MDRGGSKVQVQKEKLGGHRSFEDSDKEMHPEWGGWDAPRRPEACKFPGKKKKKSKPHGAEDAARSGMGTDRQRDRQTILLKSREAYLQETREGVN